MTRLLIMGPPGAGKGTQAELVAKRFGVPAISTGDIFRANIAASTPMGVEVQKYLDAGEYVPDSITNEMVRDRLNESDAAEGFLLDGYPRTLSQVEFLDGVLAESGTELDHVIELTVDVDEVVARLHKRAKEEGRTDDSEEVIRRRQEVYFEETAPLIAVYSDRGLVFKVDGMGMVEEVAARVADAVSRPPHG
ncbi:adenylate kinase [Haloactinopolyspora alba]|uniref:Adenylate kinase n=1 Tax=Haloactinopolyspora alba TaxID=648780 RepID=A0A2P8DPL7_9ACTN|nr:adenylate kinase [Haloactinopolyspora alba]PSK99143.1 adenylate kinase [Haloactinopolyspora alba]